MSQNTLRTQLAVLTNKEKTEDRLLFSGKITTESKPLSSCMFYLFEIFGASEKLKKSILSVLERNFRQYCDDLNEDCFEKVIESINATLDNAVRNGEKDWIGNLNAVIGFSRRGEIFISQTGNISGYLFRKNKISEIVSSSKLTKPPLPLNTFTDITYGQLSEDDRVIIGNSELYNHLSLDRLRKMLCTEDASTATSFIFDFFRKMKITSSNCIVFSIEGDETVSENKNEEMPDIYYVDQIGDSLAKKLQEEYLPKAREAALTFSKFSKKTYGKGQKYILESISKLQEKHEEITAKKQIAETKKDKFAPGSPSNKALLGKVSQTIKPKFKTSSYKGKKLENLNSVVAILEKTLETLKTLLLPKNRKYLYSVLIVIFFALGYAKVKDNNEHRNEIKNQMEASDAYNKAKDLYNTAKDNLALGKSTASNELSDALVLAKKAEGYAPNKEKALTLEKEIQVSIDSITNTNRIYDPVPVLAFNKNSAKIISIGSEFIVVTKEGKIYSAESGDKEPVLVSSLSKDAGEPINISYFEKGGKVLILTAKKQIFSLDPVSKTINALSLEQNTTKWQGLKAVNSYSSNVYVLDSDAGQIWKYTQNDTGFSKGTAAIDAEKSSIRGATDIAIDGNVYALLNTGKVTKFMRGNPETFELKNLPTGQDKISVPTKIFTDENTNFIFILDKSTERILRFNKGGEYIGQYFLNGLPIDDFIVNGKTQKIWALSAGNLYEINF